MTKMKNITTYIIYAIVFLVVVMIAIPTEKADMMCPQGPYTKNKKLCKEGNGKLFKYSKFNEKDTIKTTSRKLQKLIDDKKTQIIWRRLFIQSVIIVFLLNFIVTDNIPDGKQFFISTLLVYFILLSFTNFYNTHYYNLFDNKIKQGLEIIFKLEDQRPSTKN